MKPPPIRSNMEEHSMSLRNLPKKFSFNARPTQTAILTYMKKFNTAFFTTPEHKTNEFQQRLGTSQEPNKYIRIISISPIISNSYFVPNL
jgi:hypothetical protein